MIIKWPERYSLVMLLHTFIHELKFHTKMTNKQQKTKQKSGATEYDSNEKSNECNCLCKSWGYSGTQRIQTKIASFAAHCYEDTFPFLYETTFHQTETAALRI